MSSKSSNSCSDPQVRYQKKLFRLFWSVVHAYECFLEEVNDGDERDFVLEHYCLSIDALKRAVLSEFIRYDDFLKVPSLVLAYGAIQKYYPLKVRFAREARFYENRVKLGLSPDADPGLIEHSVKELISRPFAEDESCDDLPF